ncbi:protocatechuate 3,4-dioxygenase subunit alpha [Chachezhania antarctica]|uniref:protocatechuate 3,4-dioxygenase subunit alpha n=1 Tax=Chachezhania antarctica TaxID=2340860 RepID=UPI000EAE0499|nr:protocatechuate 3,4-dioxygenase subunit alpha [Chachezhania antarctica]|tara:strand:- start:2619 stop:3185 length:567 start_codon:yes stop_codon:yes gene_type:complete
MVQKLDTLEETPSQTAGPYVHIGATPNFAGIGGIYPEDLGLKPFPDDAEGERITIRGIVHDGTGTPMRDVLVESWQANADGQYGPGTQGWARLPADQENGIWTLETIKPGAVGAMAPHIALWIVSRGINIGLQTRIYFDGDDLSADPVLARVEHRNRLPTLIAKSDGPGSWRFDIHLQGDAETIFFDM